MSYFKKDLKNAIIWILSTASFAGVFMMTDELSECAAQSGNWTLIGYGTAACIMGAFLLTRPWMDDS